MLVSETLTPSAPAEQVADADITAAIDMFFLTKKGVNSHLIDVATREGIVELTGSADNLLARERAEEIALAVRGVRGVINELVIKTSDVPDARLLTDVEQALTDDAATNDYDVRCTVHDGVVTLAGTVQTWAEKQLVLRVLRGVKGVRQIREEQLRIRGGEIQNSDAEITTQIREQLDWDIQVNSALVEVRTNERVVHLAGTVGTAAEKTRIVATAYQAGATRVDARDLFVAYWALGRELRQEKFAPKPDEAIAQAVRDVLRLDPRVRAYHPMVRVRDGVVTLSGPVSNLRAKQAAELDTRNVVGVWDVHNLLKVRTERVSPDGDIQQTIVDALARDPYVHRFSFTVNVHNGKVYLYGRVDNHFEQEQASLVAASVNGVLDVENRVLVAGQESPDAAWPDFLRAAPARHAASPDPDHALAESIRTRFFWSASLHDQDVEVRVENGRATLTGTVDTWLERRLAAREAYEVGARDVNNHLRVLMDKPSL
ncbi:BON domain-containing protein [Hymenobacter aquaticus]|uniref:BON domain-containing protein n=1 Tax=Hymenobacter aquaticus TaxID=1867101 RepID=A0A4Z0Q1M9_9BACT|nr:BON domain-containing protein [Hymenobacter aquaticus]TGE23890.1 BON domain-containing protein [Hymenobacter aquaticus]